MTVTITSPSSLLRGSQPPSILTRMTRPLSETRFPEADSEMKSCVPEICQQSALGRNQQRMGKKKLKRKARHQMRL